MSDQQEREGLIPEAHIEVEEVGADSTLRKNNHYRKKGNRPRNKHTRVVSQESVVPQEHSDQLERQAL